MTYDRQFWCRAGALLGIILALTGCAYDAAVRQLSLAEQAEFYLYKKVMTPAQARAYLARASATERTAYLRETGLAQRFEALEPLDRAAVQSGFPRVGMSTDALLFVWGEPYYTAGEAQRAAHWHYVGSSLALGASGNQYSNSGNRVDVYIVAGKIVGWVDYALSTEEQGDDWGGASQ
jgi:hypothetical protein